MSGFCSTHQGHDPTCFRCLAVPLTDLDIAYYRGWDERLESIHRNGWICTEAHVMDAFEELEVAVRARGTERVANALAALDELRRLNRGFRA
jgi:hypothetical protein